MTTETPREQVETRTAGGLGWPIADGVPSGGLGWPGTRSEEEAS